MPIVLAEQELFLRYVAHLWWVLAHLMGIGSALPNDFEKIRDVTRTKTLIKPQSHSFDQKTPCS